MDDERKRREERFTLLYDAHKSAVRAYAWRRGPDTADDVVAETFSVAWQRLDDVPADPLPWLIGVARNARLNLMRGERRRRAREARCASEDVVPSFAGAVEARAALRATLQRLTERDRRDPAPGRVGAPRRPGPGRGARLFQDRGRRAPLPRQAASRGRHGRGRGGALPPFPHRRSREAPR